MPWLSKRVQISWTESSMPAIAITQWIISSVGPSDCAKCEPRFAGSMRARLGSASAARKTSIRGASPQSRGLPPVSSARRLRIVGRKHLIAGWTHRSSWKPERSCGFCSRGRASLTLREQCSAKSTGENYALDVACCCLGSLGSWI